MNANPRKYQIICIGQKAYDAIKSAFQLHDTTITNEDKVTLLGVSIGYLLNLTIIYLKFVKKLLKNLPC